MAHYSDKDATPEERLAAAVAEFPVHDIEYAPITLSDDGSILLIEQSIDGDWYLTLHKSKSDAVDYTEKQEHPEYWDCYAFVDLNTGKEV